jgi:hypothetical protein
LSRPASALQAAAISRGMAQLITTPAFRKWVTNTRQYRPDAVAQSQTVATAPAIFDTLAAGLGENQDVQTAMEWLREGMSQVDTAGRRITRPPQGSKSWEQFLGGDELMDAMGVQQ